MKVLVLPKHSWLPKFVQAPFVVHVPTNDRPYIFQALDEQSESIIFQHTTSPMPSGISIDFHL
jgi:hypothetical protein